MRRMSFMLTMEQMRAGTKTVTRRRGWWRLKPGDRVMAVEKCMGLKGGERQVEIGEIEIVAVKPEMLDTIERYPEYGREECDKEGFWKMDPSDFVAMFCKTHAGIGPRSVINRIEFRPLYVTQAK